MSDWYLYREGAAPYGPISGERIHLEVRAGALPLTTLVCSAAAGASWQPLSSIPELCAGADGEPTTMRWQSARPPPPAEASSRKLLLIGGATVALVVGAGLALVLLRRPTRPEP